MFLLCLSAGPARKIKRVSDVNAMGAPMAANPYMADPFAQQQQQQTFGGAPAASFIQQPNQPSAFSAAPQFQTHPQTLPNQQQQSYPDYANFNAAPNAHQIPQTPQQPQLFNPMAPQAIPGFGVFQQPIVQSMAMEYGQQLADQGKQMMESQFEKYIPVTRLKYYFAVDNNYVINKLRLLFFPFTHSVCIYFINNYLI